MQSLAILLLLIVILAPPAPAFKNHEAKEEVAALQLDGFFGYQKEIGAISADRPTKRGYGYSFFPITTIGEHDLLGGAEFSVTPQQFFEQGSNLNGDILQSYGLGLGYQSYHSAQQEGFAYGMIGINGDMRNIGPINIYGDFSYTHKIAFSNRLTLGGGFNLHFYFGTCVPYPVLLLDWQVAKHTKLKFNFDTGEVKQFLSDRLSGSLGAQYDIFHYGFGLKKGYAMESTSGMMKLEYRLGESVYARLLTKKPFWDEETVWSKSGQIMKNTGNEGVSIRLQIVYGG